MKLSKEMSYYGIVQKSDKWYYITDKTGESTLEGPYQTAWHAGHALDELIEEQLKAEAQEEEDA